MKKMSKLKLGAIADEKPVKLTVFLRSCIAICLLTPRRLPAKPGSRSPIPQNWLRRSWHGSWRRTARLQKLDAKIKSKGRDSALSAASGNPPMRDSRCPAASILNGPPELDRSHPGPLDGRHPRSSHQEKLQNRRENKSSRTPIFGKAVCQLQLIAIGK